MLGNIDYTELKCRHLLVMQSGRLSALEKVRSLELTADVEGAALITELAEAAAPVAQQRKS